VPRGLNVVDGRRHGLETESFFGSVKHGATALDNQQLRLCRQTFRLRVTRRKDGVAFFSWRRLNGLGAKENCLNLSAETEVKIWLCGKCSALHSALVTERRCGENRRHERDRGDG
jgi:hypothetical protein